MMNMFFQGVGVDEDIIEVDKDEPVYVMEGVIDRDLEDSGDVGQTKGITKYL